jgi:hypothetical protein
MEGTSTNQRAAWSLAEISNSTGLSLGFLRNEARRGNLPVKRFGRRVLVLTEDLHSYLARGSEDAKRAENISPGQAARD